MPSYQFNKFTGRLKESTHPQPFYPLSAKPLHSTEPPIMVFDSPKTQPAKIMSGTAKYSTVPPKFLNAFKKLVDLESPVFLAFGAKDKLLFRASALVVVGSSILNVALMISKMNKKA